MRGLQGKTAIVTGGLGDLGYAAAQRLCQEGVQVAVFDVKADEDGQAAAIGASFHQVDIADEPQVETACAAAEQAHGPATILVNCAAAFVFKSVEATAAD
ncbi:MAG: SDR family NAD(P)-dependent oxidoreductase [Candidatus Latescibacteria bacterium]|nr:SDR family NAD(P)-dependent oxidoreductase [Candidatus Latescibacterota bacterium]